MFKVHQIGYIFTDGPYDGFEQVCNGLWYAHGPETWTPNWEPGPKKFLQYPKQYGVLPYLYEDFEFFGVNLLADFPYAPHDIISIIQKNVELHAAMDSIAIINAVQAECCEELLLNCGFAVINRTINPLHNSKISLYHRKPTA